MDMTVTYIDNGVRRFEHFRDIETAVAHALELRRLPEDHKVTDIQLIPEGTKA